MSQPIVAYITIKFDKPVELPLKSPINLTIEGQQILGELSEINSDGTAKIAVFSVNTIQ